MELTIVKISMVMFKLITKIILYLFIIIFSICLIFFSYFIWQMWSNYQFHQQFYSYFSKNCGQQRQCIVELHKITPFQWDHAYIFTMKSLKDINQITQKSFNVKDYEAKIIFIKNNKTVNHGSLDLIDDNDIADRLDKYLNVYFTYSTEKLPISYYTLQPDNDRLIIGYGDYNVSGHKQWAGYDISPSNIQQVHLVETK